MAFLPNRPTYTAGKIVGIYLCGIFGPNLSIVYSWGAANYAGHTKKTTINAIILAAYGASNICGPLTFTGATAPQYIPAKVAIMASLALAVATTLVLRYVYVSENKARDRRALAKGEQSHVFEFGDQTDKENQDFRVSLLSTFKRKYHQADHRLVCTLI